jgi:hypothetical protein
MENTESNNNKMPVTAKVDPAVYAAVERLAREDDRSVSNMVERLLKQSPLVSEILNAESAEAAINQ